MGLEGCRYGRAGKREEGEDKKGCLSVGTFSALSRVSVSGYSVVRFKCLIAMMLFAGWFVVFESNHL